jgi:DNA-binding transcriptional LysR family regulator
LAALRAGVGIGICQNVIAARDPALRRILPDLTFDLEVWLVVHPDRRSSLIVRTVFDLLAAGLRRLA